MNNRPNTGRVDLKTSPAAKIDVKSEQSTLAGSQADAVQRDKGSRFSSVRDGESRVEQSQSKSVEVEKNVKPELASTDTDTAAAETESLQKEKKFSGRCRLFVGNLPNGMSENEFQKFFEGFGELNEVFLNASRGFGFIRLVSVFCQTDHKFTCPMVCTTCNSCHDSMHFTARVLTRAVKRLIFLIMQFIFFNRALIAQF